MLTGDYMPEYGRVSGGQIRMVTKSGGNRFQRQRLVTSCATTSCRPTPGRATRARTRSRTAGAAPFDYKQYAYSFGGPIMKDKLFFFGAQEWVNYLAGADTNLATVPTRSDAARRLQRAARRATPSSARAQIIRDPLTGQPFPDNVIPSNRLSANGLALLTRLPAADPGLPVGHATTRSSTARTRRTSARTTSGSTTATTPNNTFTYRYGKYNWMAVDAFRGTFPFARTDWDRPNTTQTASWTSTLKNNIVNEASYTLLARRGLHQRVRERSLQAEQVRHHLSVHLPGQQGDPGQDPDHHDRQLHGDRRRPVSFVIGRARSTRSRTRRRG